MTDTRPGTASPAAAGTPPDAAPARRSPLRPGAIAIYAVGPLIFIGAWELVGRAGLLGNGMFPPFSQAVSALADWILATGAQPTTYSGTWAEHALISSGRILVGFGIGAAAAVVVGALVGRFALAAKLVDPMVNALRPISVTAWVPVALIIFGIGNSPAFFLTGLATFFPIYVNTVDGMRSADGKFTRAARMLGASEAQVLLRVMLPAALPGIVTGLRVGMAIAWTTVVVAEVLGAKSGVGYVLMDAYNQFLFPYVIAAMITVGALGFLCDRILVAVFTRPLRWVAIKGDAR